MAPSAPHVASRAASSPVDQLDLFAVLAPRVATFGTEPPRQRPQAPSRRDLVPSWPFTDARPLAVEVAETAAQTAPTTLVFPQAAAIVTSRSHASPKPW